MFVALFTISVFLRPVEDTIQYQVIIDQSVGEINHLSIEVSFKGEADGESFLRLPIGFAGETELWRAVHDFSSNVTLHETDQPFFYRLTYEAESHVTIQYEIRQDWKGPPSASASNPYRPVIQPDYFHAHGITVFPIVYSDRRTRMNRPTAVHLVTPKDQTILSDAQGARTVHDVRNSIIVGGDYTLESLVRGDTHLRVATRPGFSIEANIIANTLDAIDEFWGAEPRDFLVTFLPLEPAEFKTVGGTPIGDGLAMYVSKDAPFELVHGIMRHEYIHDWIPAQMGDFSSGQDAGQDNWFTEGFTDFYAWRLGARSGALSVDDAIQQLNDILEEYARLPVAGIPASQLTEHENLTDFDLGRLPILRGFLVAKELDSVIREMTYGQQDLDDVMLAGLSNLNDGQRAQAYLSDLTSSVTGTDISSILHDMLDSGDEARLSPDVLSACGQVLYSEDQSTQLLLLDPNLDEAACRDQIAGLN